MVKRRLTLLIAGNILLFVVAFILLSGLLEAYLRWHEPPPGATSGLVWDRELGWNANPSVRPLQNVGTGSVVLFLGDSFTDGVSWPLFAQGEAQKDGMHFEGFNLGVAGYGTTQELLKLRQYIAAHRPQLIVLLFFAWNDFRDNVEYPTVFYSTQTTDRPYLKKTAGGYVPQPFHASGLLSLLLRSHVFSRLFQNKLLQAQPSSASLSTDKILEQHLPFAFSYADPIAWEPFYRDANQEHPYVHEAYAVTTDALRILRDDVRRSGAKLLLVGLDNAFTVDKDVAAEWLPPDEDINPQLPLRRLQEIAVSLEIPYISALPTLQELHRASGKKVYNGPAGNLSGHLEPEANEAIGQLVGREIVLMLNP